MLKSSDLMSPAAQDQSYSPQTFDLLDWKANSQEGEPSGLLPRPRTARSSARGGTDNVAFPTFPKFPTIFELAQLADPPPVVKNPPGVFEMYMSKDPAHILQDATTESHYDARALSLLGELQQGSRKFEQLTSAEKALLDEAALDFFHPPKKITTKPSSLAMSPPTVKTQDGELPKVEPVEGPVMDAFWWT